MFRPGLPEGFGDRAAQLGPNALGYSALFLWPCSLTATTVSPRPPPPPPIPLFSSLPSSGSRIFTLPSTLCPALVSLFVFFVSLPP